MSSVCIGNLYISDLDGMLLRDNAALPDFAEEAFAVR